MIHIGMQVNNMEDVVKALEPLGIKSAIDFENDKQGIYLMSIEPLNLNNIEDYTDKELMDEIKIREI